MAALEKLLTTENLCRHFGGLKAVDGIDFELKQGEIHALIGPNGAGKSTFVHLLCGQTPISSGKILFQGKDISAMPAHKRVTAGIVYTFQLTSIFSQLPVFDNVALPVQKRLHIEGLKISAHLHDRVMAVLQHVGIAQFADQIAGTLSYGHQRILEIAMGIALKPKLLILDEPTQGLSEGEITHFKTFIRRVGVESTLMLIEHNMDVVMDLADRITVLDGGKILALGTPQEIHRSPDVQRAYLGSGVKKPNPKSRVS